jgi:hypothetical protein
MVSNSARIVPRKGSESKSTSLIESLVEKVQDKFQYVYRQISTVLKGKRKSAIRGSASKIGKKRYQGRKIAAAQSRILSGESLSPSFSDQDTRTVNQVSTPEQLRIKALEDQIDLLVKQQKQNFNGFHDDRLKSSLFGSSLSTNAIEMQVDSDLAIPTIATRIPVPPPLPPPPKDYQVQIQRSTSVKTRQQKPLMRSLLQEMLKFKLRQIDKSHLDQGRNKVQDENYLEFALKERFKLAKGTEDLAE